MKESSDLTGHTQNIDDIQNPHSSSIHGKTECQKAARAIFSLLQHEQDVARLKSLYLVIDALFYNCDQNLTGTYLELRLWCGLKIDTPAMGEPYIHGVIESYPWLAE